MSFKFDGITITAGAGLVSAPNSLSSGTLGTHKFTLKDTGGVGFSIDPFSVTIGEDCDHCVPQPGDWIKATATTILLLDITTYSWSLCNKRCTGSKTVPGLSLGIGIKMLTWEL